MYEDANFADLLIQRRAKSQSGNDVLTSMADLTKDITTDENFIIDSCVETEEKTTHEGVEYPLVKVEISSSSHPFYSGKERSGGTTGRIEKFNKKYKLKQ